VTGRRVVLPSLSSAMDGGFTAISDVSHAMSAAGTTGEYRLIGGMTVMLHIQRLGLDLPLRGTADADFGVPPHVLRQSDLVEAIEALGYSRTFGNRWERPIKGRGTAAVDLLVPAYRSRSRDTVKVGDVITTEVPGLAEALRRPGLGIEAELRMTDGTVLAADIVLPDAIGALALKAGARSVRHEARDAEDLWRCLEIAAADGVTPEMFDGDTALEELRSDLWRELGPNGHSLASLTGDLQDDPAARRRTRVRALLADTIGTIRA
jgi:hypothetical protein